MDHQDENWRRPWFVKKMHHCEKLAARSFEEKHLPSSSVAPRSSLCLTSLRPSESDSSSCVSSSVEISSPEEKLALIWAKSNFLAILSKVDKKGENVPEVYFMINNIIFSSILQRNIKLKVSQQKVFVQSRLGWQVFLCRWPHQLHLVSHFMSQNEALQINLQTHWSELRHHLETCM